MLNKESKIERLAKKIRKVQVIGAILAVALVIVLCLLGIKFWIAFTIAILPPVIIAYFLGVRLSKELGIYNNISLKKEVFVMLVVFLTMIGIAFFVSEFSDFRYIIWFILISLLPIASILKKRWISKLEKEVKEEKREEFKKVIDEIARDDL